MAAVRYRRAVIFNLLCVLPTILAQGYTIPNVSIQALKPRGLRIFMQGDSAIQLLVFEGNINREIKVNEIGDISIQVTPSGGHKFAYEDSEVNLNVGDVINYYIEVVTNKIRHQNDKLSYTVTELLDPNAFAQPPVVPTKPPTPQATQPPPTTSSSGCVPTMTSVMGRDTSVCSGDIIFEDDFDTLREEIWKIEQYIPTKPEYPFVSYQRPANAPTVSVKDGMLRIEPKLQQTLPGFDSDSIILNDNVLDLNNGCTQPACTYTNAGAQIMPPIASGRLTTAWFSFKYGVIEVRAKLPQGDWLYPDVILESHRKQYGFENYASGIMRIAGALGNVVLTKSTQEYGNKVLYGGPVMDYKCRSQLLSRKISESAWGDDFHLYSLRWEPDRITIYVDGEEYGRVEPTASGLHNLLPKYTCDPPRESLQSPLAPFDDFFRITLGVSAGGISEFPDQVTGPNLKPKPWKNNSRVARLRFFEALSSWYPTWTQSALLVDYIRVRAL